MFPSFESLAQREQKRQELLERVQRRVRQANAKRDMYAGAQWASDGDKTITTAPKKTEISTQTDESDSKKSLSDANSQTNPELSSTESGTQTEVDARPQMIDVGVDNGVRMVHSSSNTDRVNQTDRKIQARPQTSDIGIDNAPQTADIGIDNTPRMVDAEISSTPKMVDAETTMKRKAVDTEEQVAARQWVKDLYKANPNWVALRINPVGRRTGEADGRYYLGKNGSVITVKSGKKNKNYQAFDWIATEEDIRDIWYDGESRSIDENSNMRLEDPLYHASLMTRKRKIADPSEGDYADRTKQRLEDSFEFNTSTSTSSDQTDSKNRLLWSIFKNKEVLESAGLKKKIVPVLKSTGKTSQVDKTGYVWIDGSSISVFGIDSGRVKPAITKKVDWRSTFQEFIQLVKDRDDIAVFSNGDSEKFAKDFVPGDGEARHGIKIGIDEDMDSNLTNADNDAKKILMDYYTKLSQKEGVKIPFRLNPVVDSEKGVKVHQNYYFGEPTSAKPFYIRNRENKPVSGKVWNDLMKTIRWMDTFNGLISGFEDLERYVYENDDPALKRNIEANLQLLNRAILDNTKSTDVSARIKSSEGRQYRDDALQKLHDESEAAFQKYGEAQKKYEEAKQVVKGNNSKSARSALKAATAAMKATKAVYLLKSKNYSDAQKYTDPDQFSDRQDDRTIRRTVKNNMVDQVSGSGIKRKLKGRSLRGAGVAPLEGVVRRGRTYNLNEIQGLATPSAYIYRQLGSKYVRIPDLDAKTLVIVQPNRRKCGPKREISDQLQAMIRTLAFKQHIDQAEYDKLSIDDKKLFKEILAITHLQYNFHDRLEDPLESLRAEYDKLKGELELGNGNPSIIKQLKSLSVDMYSNRLISDSEFKDIIVRLI